MSGLEILGIAASILQIADLGATVSVKLCTFYRQLKAADQAAQSLSSEVALTCSILRQLGENLKQDEETRLYSAQAFETAQEVLRECEKVFRRISGAIDESRSDATKNAIQRAARRLGFVLMERELDVLRGNLERLKSTMLLLLNVIMYAGQVRSRAESSVLQEQRELIRVLVEEKKASERRLDQLRRSDELVKALDSLDTNHSEGSAVQDTLPPYEGLAQEDVLRELRTYHQLVKRLLEEVDACKSGIERSRYSRIRNGVVRVHAAEVEQFRRARGAMVTRLFEDPLFSLAPETDVPEVETHAEDKTDEAERLQRKKDIARRRPVQEVDTRRHRRFPPEPNRRDRLPLQPSGWIDADDFRIDSPTERSRINDRMRDYLPRSRAAFDYAPPPPAGIVDIENEYRNQSTNRSADRNRRRRQDDTARFDIEWNDETIPRRRRRRRASISASRETSPRHQRDYDLLADQRILEKNDAREDLELMKQQMEIERLERQLARRCVEHENNQVQLIKEEEDRYEDEDDEDEISERLRRLERIEKKQPMEEEGKDTEFRLKLRKFEEAERQATEEELASGEHVDVIPVPATETEKQVKEAVDAVDDFVSREASPDQRDYDLVEQRILEMNDALQDLKLWKQQMEIELQQELAVDAISVPATETEQEVKEAVDAVDDLLLKWTTLGQDDLLA